MRVLTIVHQRDAGPGVFGEAAGAAGHELAVWLPPEAPPPQLDGFGAAMVFGGAMDVDQEGAHPWLAGEKQLLRELLGSGIPVLGVCLGAQLLSEAAGGSPRRAARPEIGWHEIELTGKGRHDPLLTALPARFEGFSWHSYETSPPPEAAHLAASDVCLQAYRLNGSSWGIQFHAEVTSEAVGRWLDDYENDEDAVRIGLDPEALRAETAGKIEAWNKVGRALCERFLSLATRA